MKINFNFAFLSEGIYQRNGISKDLSEEFFNFQL